MRIKTVGALAAIVASSAVLSGCPGTSSVPGQNIMDLINAKRVANGCAEVRGDDQLRAAAERHAVDIRDHPQHYGPPGTDPPLRDIHAGTDGSNAGARIAAAGYAPVRKWGEIIYWAGGPPGNTPEASVEWWKNSPRHWAQIVDCTYQHVGVGLLYPGGEKWIAVVNFGAH